MPKYMVTHRSPELNWHIVERNWSELAGFEHAQWIKTYFNVNEGVRYCIWLARDTGKLKQAFAFLDIGWESILEIEETTPDMWGRKRTEHIKAEAIDMFGF
jgi:Nickel responsive protein SCO4226-like